MTALFTLMLETTESSELPTLKMVGVSYNKIISSSIYLIKGLTSKAVGVHDKKIICDINILNKKLLIFKNIKKLLKIRDSEQNFLNFSASNIFFNFCFNINL